MQTWKQQFIQYALDIGAIRFGQFTTKSGRVSPYFFNSGLFNTGAALVALSDLYCQTIQNNNVQFDVLFGPAYKGIPLVAAIATTLMLNYKRDVPYCFDRKEAKDHGEQGVTVGAPLQGDVAIVDDVITNGGAKIEAIELIKKQQAKPVSIIIAFDRQEVADNQTISAAEAITQSFGIPIYSGVNLIDLITFTEQQNLQDKREKLLQYANKFGTEKLQQQIHALVC